MKKIILTATTFALAASVSAQLKVDATGNTRATGNIYLESTSNFLGTTSDNVPITFKVNGMLSGSTGSANTANVSLGYGANAITTGEYNTATGFAALYRNTTGSHNTSTGYRALYANTTGSHNTAFGTFALSDNTTGISNTATGYGTLANNTTGSENTANGYGALAYNTTAGYNAAFGAYTLFQNTTGGYSTAIGYLALYNNTTGIDNTALGHRALYSNTTGINNTASGGYALYNNTTGFYNTAFGRNALHTNTAGNFNTAIGYYADISATSLSNAIAIGHNAIATSSNQARIGSSAVTSIGGYAAWTNFSDKRAKKNIRADVPGLEFINRLQPVTYNMDLDVIDELLKPNKEEKQGEEVVPQGERLSQKATLPQEGTSPQGVTPIQEATPPHDVTPPQGATPPQEEALPQELIEINKKAREAKEKQLQTGFLAQDVEEVAKSIGYEFSGVDVDEKGIYGLRYAEFVVPLVKAVQELSEQNDRLLAQLNELTELVYSLQGKDNAPALEENAPETKSTGLQDATSSGASLQQNSPNPFSQATAIRYTLPQTGKAAQLVVSSTAGSIVRQIPLQPGTDSVTIEGGALAAGIYYYSLYVGSSLVDTKTMVLTK